MPHSAPLVPAQLAERFGLSVPEFSRALFELNRCKSLYVTQEAYDHTAQFHHDVVLLCEDLRALAMDGQQLLLASADGLCLAGLGLSEKVCTHQAAVCHQGSSQDFPYVIPLHLGTHIVRLCSAEKIDGANAALLRLARRMIGLQLPFRLHA